MVDLSKYRDLFISEAREILSGFQTQLILFERGESGLEAVHEMFRGAHSLKGMAASMGYNEFAALAHAWEDLASAARDDGKLSTQAVDLMLEVLDVLEASVEAMEQGAESATCACDDLVQRIRAYVKNQQAGSQSTQSNKSDKDENADSANAQKKVESATHASPQSAATVEPGHEQRRYHVIFSAEAKAPQVRAFMLHRALEKILHIDEILPSLAELKAGQFPENHLQLLLSGSAASLLQAEELAQTFTDVQNVRVEDVRAEPELAQEAVAEKRSVSGRVVRVKAEILDEFIDSVGELLRARDRLRGLARSLDLPELYDLSDELISMTKDLHEKVMLARMTPLSVLTERLPRVVRDLSRRDGRQVELLIEGAEIELDRALLDDLHSAFLHLVRNAVDHGHAGAEQRKKAGKPEYLTIAIRARRMRDQVLIDVEDDGRGMDPKAIAAAAVRKGLLDEAGASGLSESEALALICTPGFSTAEEVTEVSGRGVGMDSVRASLTHLGGDLEIRSKPGMGSRFTLRLPLTMAIISVMIVEVENERFAIPTNRISHARDFEQADFSSSMAEQFLRIDGEMFHFFDLAELLGYAQKELQGGTVVLIEDSGILSALRVERIVGMHDVVVKPVGEPLAKLDFMAGAALLGGGEPAFILDIGRLVRRL